MITDAELTKFLAETEESLKKYKKRYCFSSQKSDERIVMDNLIELAVTAYESNYITYEKLEYLLGISNLKPKDLGINEEVSCEFPSDDELESIMEE